MKKLAALLLALSLLLALCACGTHTLQTEEAVQEEVPASVAEEEPEAEPASEPEPAEETEPEHITTYLTAATELTADELTYESGNGILQNFYLPLVVCVDGEYHSDVLAGWSSLGGTTFRIQILDGISDSDGNPFTTDDVMALFEGNEQITDLTARDETTVTLTMTGATFADFQDLLCHTFAVTKAAKASGDALPAGFGPYLVESAEGSVLRLSRNDACPASDEDPCTLAAADFITLTCGVSAADQAAQLAAGTLDIACELESAVEDSDCFTSYTGTCSFLIRSASCTKDLTSLFALLDHDALAKALGQAASSPIVPKDYPDAVNFTYTNEEDSCSLTLTLAYESSCETAAQAVAEAIKATGASVTLKACADGVDSTTGWDIAYVEATAPTAPELLEQLIGYNAEKGTCRYTVEGDEAAQVLALFCSPYGMNAGNITLLGTVFTDNITGLTAEITRCGANADRTAVASTLGVLFGSAIPENYVAPEETVQDAGTADTAAPQ